MIMEFFMPTRIIYEKNCVRNHAECFAGFGKKALIVTGKTSAKKNGSLQDVCSVMETQGLDYVIYDQIEENPSIETVMDARNIALQNQVDFIIGIGGGSPLDAAKAIAMMTAHPECGADVLYQNIDLDYLPVIAVPTTAGTGSEVTPWSILTIHAKRTKQSIPHKIFPAVALADASYLAYLPKRVRISTAVDTLAHLIESHLVTKASTYSRIFTREGLKAWAQIRDCVGGEQLSEADYSHMMHACTMGGIAITHTGTGLPHALSYMITYETGLAHGLACGYSLAGLLEQYEDQGKVREVLALLGFESTFDFRCYLKQLMEEIEISDALWQANIASVLCNDAKLKSFPYPVDAEKLVKFRGK